MNYLRRRDLLPVTGFDTREGGETENEGKDKTVGEGFETTRVGRRRGWGGYGTRVWTSWQVPDD